MPSFDSSTRTSQFLSEQFLLLDERERRDVYITAAAGIGLPPEVLEKDVWICWTLDVLFADPNALPMAFKGGTSLSKVFGAIERFSEDIDVTVGLASARLGPNEDLPESRNARDKLRKTLTAELAKHIATVVTPALSRALSDIRDAGDRAVTSVSQDTLVLDYPSCFTKHGGYLHERVQIEFGARNAIEPNTRHTLVPYLVDVIGATGIVLPSAEVDVLSPKRTFWEKATLAHDECNRADWSRGAKRISRHWYDLAVLADHPIGVEALNDRDLLQDVVRIKDAFYGRSTSAYGACLTGGLRLLPGAEGRAVLNADHDAMIEAGMFSGVPPTFGWILDRLTRLEHDINALR